MRGKHVYRLLLDEATRIIPAHAGQTAILTGCRSWRKDHPRACGANGHCDRHYRMIFGSSPRMRGKPAGYTHWSAASRIIPAHAGQTPRSAEHGERVTDHPRACGANHVQHPVEERVLGSSPRMRGKLTQHVILADFIRIIPAHAGQTVVGLVRVVEGPDHPRACGANSIMGLLMLAPNGSSPRMRGKHPCSR